MLGMHMKRAILAGVLIATLGGEVMAQATQPTTPAAPKARVALEPGEVLGRRREPDGTLIIRAKFMSSPVTEHKTRLLADLKEFAPTDVKLDRYGGWLTDQKFTATGFFRAEKQGDRWWIIDPDGNRFLHMAVVSVSPGSSPQMKRAFPDKFETKEKWRDQTQGMLRELGFNGTGSWSDDALLQSGESRSAYTPLISFMASYGKKKGITRPEPGHTGFPNRCIPIFDPEFADHCAEVAKGCEKYKDDPWLLGYYSDNELPFPKDSLNRFLKAPEGDTGRQAAAEWLKARGKTEAEITDEDRNAWAAYVMERYLSTVSAAIRKVDPNHMYLGPRFHGEERGMPDVLAVAGKYLDVIAVNIYGNWDPGYEAARIEKMAGRPIVVTEWYAKGMDTGLPNTTGAGWTVATQQDRADFYEHFTLSLLEMKAAVGWHWFKYINNDPEDLKAELSNRDANKGMLTVKYEPYAPMVEAMKRINHAAYALTGWFDGKD